MAVTKQENLDVARILTLTAETPDVSPSTSELLQRAASLLRRTTYLWILSDEKLAHVKKN